MKLVMDVFSSSETDENLDRDDSEKLETAYLYSLTPPPISINKVSLASLVQVQNPLTTPHQPVVTLNK